MAKNDFRFNRHLKLWEEQNKLIKRSIIAILIFGLLVLVNVLKPFPEKAREPGEIAQQIESYKTEKLRLNEFALNLTQADSSLLNVQNLLNNHPWHKEKNKLIDKFRWMNRESGRRFSRKEYQDTANVKIREISGIAKELIVSPMENMVKQNPNIKEELPELSKKLDDIRSSLKQWEEENINQNWYRTIPEKSATIARLNDTLEEQVKNFSKILNTELKQIQEKRQQVEQTTMNLNQSIVEKETRLKDLEDELDKILPGWLGGIIKVKEMIQIFPILILILNFYIVVLAFSLTRHYDYVRQQVNLSRTDSKDLSASTVWTLTNRGRLGNTLTLLVYVIFMLIMWQFYEMGHGYLLDWKNNLTEEQISWYLKILCSTEFLWISRFLFLSSASIILFAIELRKFAISRKEDK